MSSDKEEDPPFEGIPNFGEMMHMFQTYLRAHLRPKLQVPYFFLSVREQVWEDKADLMHEVAEAMSIEGEAMSFIDAVDAALCAQVEETLERDKKCMDTATHLLSPLLDDHNCKEEDRKTVLARLCKAVQPDPDKGEWSLQDLQYAVEAFCRLRAPTPECLQDANKILDLILPKEKLSHSKRARTQILEALSAAVRPAEKDEDDDDGVTKKGMWSDDQVAYAVRAYNLWN